MKALILIALLFVALALAGCTGADNTKAAPNASAAAAPKTAGIDQFLNNSTNSPTPSTPAQPTPSEPQTPPAEPAAVNASPAGTGSLTWDQKDALKITMLRKGEKMAFTSWQVRLDNITFVGSPVANYQILSGDGKPLSAISLGQNQSYRFTASDGVEYLVVAVFRVGEGMPSAVQTQAYKVSDLGKSSGAQISAPLNSYNLKLDYPVPVMMVNKTLVLGDTAFGGALGAELVSIDRSSTPPTVNLRIVDGAGSELGRAALRNGQMVDVRMPSGERYSVVMAGMGSGETAIVAIYQKK